tara:strand:+ start:499 stop:981 length:483 start_codon:yes stop_codon:yes gene_type:complete
MSEILNKGTVKRVEESLKKFDPKIKIKFLESSARTAKDAANSLNCELGAIVKSLVFKTDKVFFICLVAGDKRCSLNKLKRILDKKDVCMADALQVKENTGFSIGGVSPTGHKKKMDIIIDNSLSRFKYVYGAAGHPDCVFRITYSDLIELTSGSVQEIIE